MNSQLVNWCSRIVKVTGVCRTAVVLPVAGVRTFIGECNEIVGPRKSKLRSNGLVNLVVKLCSTPT